MNAQVEGSKRVVRLGKIVRVFMEKDKVSSSWLSREFRTTPRTIQRDLLLLKESGFPLHEIQKGSYQLSKDLVKNLEVFDDTELALVVALKNIVAQLDEPFQKAADGVLDRLYDCVTTMPVFVRIDDPIPLDSSLLNRIVRAVKEKRQVHFQYKAGDEKTSHPVILEPYRVVYFGGFWYLIGNEPCTGILKRYALDLISNFKLSQIAFKTIPRDIDTVLRGSANIWFREERNMEVRVLVDASCAHYFKRRKMFPTQEIEEERPDGSLVVSYRVGYHEAIVNVLKSWIPHIMILSPKDFGKNMLKGLKDWVKRQERIFKE